MFFNIVSFCVFVVLKQLDSNKSTKNMPLTNTVC